MFHRLGSLKTVVRGLEKEGGTQVRWNMGVCREVNGYHLGTGFFIQGASVNGVILQHCFFLVEQHWGGCRYRHFIANFKAF